MEHRYPASQTKDLNVWSQAKRIAKCSIDEARELIPFSTAMEKMVLPMGLTQSKSQRILTLACNSQLSIDDEKELRFQTGCMLNTVQIDFEVLQQAIVQAYHGSDTELHKSYKSVQSYAKTLPDLKGYQQDLGTGPIVQFLSQIINYAIAHSASDIHISPRVSGSMIRLRINGQLRDHENIIGNEKTHLQLIRRIKVLAELDTNNCQIAQEGEFEVRTSNLEANLRVSVVPTIHGEKAVLRILGSGATLSIENLELHPLIISFIEQVLLKQQGGIICCGPTGCGKTTTLYAIVKKLTNKNLGIVTIEDPVEYRIAEISQTAVNEAQGMTYEACLKSQLRQDPDVILVGEIRDSNCAKIYHSAALSGHLLLGSLHANSVVGCLQRFIDLDISRDLLSQSMKLIIFQQLVQCLCDCKVTNLQASNVWGYEVFQAVGCEQCDYTGYSHRVPCAEALLITPELSEVLAMADFNLSKITQKFQNNNYISLQEQLLNLLKAGQICSTTHQRFST